MFQRIKFTSSLNYIIYALTIALLLIKCIMDRIKCISIRMFTFILFGTFTSFIIIIAWKKLIPVVLLLFIITVRKMDFNKIMTIVFWILFIFLVNIYCFYKLGLIGNYVTYDGKISLGYTYTTTMSHHFLSCILIYIYIYHDRINIAKIALILGINYYIFYCTGARTSFYLVILAVIIVLLKKIKCFHIKSLFLTKCCADFSIFICLFISYFMMILPVKKGIYFVINTFLSGRLSLMNSAYKQYGIPLFGTDIEWNFDGENGNYNYIDNSFYQICLLYGLIFLLIIVCSYAFTMKKLREKGYYDLIWILDLVLIHSIFEPQFIQLVYNPFILLIGIYTWTPKYLITNYNNLKY